MHLVNDQVGDHEVAVDQEVGLEVVVVLSEGVDQNLGHLVGNITLQLKDCTAMFNAFPICL